MNKLIYCILLLFFLTIVSSEHVVINSEFSSYYNNTLEFKSCRFFNGNQTEPVTDNLYYGQKQKFIIEELYMDGQTISGNCYYNVTIADNKYEELELIYYHNKKSNQEWYGMSNSQSNSYNVTVVIKPSRDIIFVISNENNK